MTRNKKIAIGITIALILVVLSALYLLLIRGGDKYFQGNYVDYELGYEMRYPSTWSIAEERRDFGIELARVVFQSKDYREKESEEYKERVEAGEETGLLQPTVMAGGAKLELLITEIPPDFQWRDWAERATDYPYGQVINEEFFTLGDKEIYGRQTESGEITSIVISFPDSEETKLFELTLHTLKKDKEKNLEIFRQILSTLNFLQMPEVELIPSDFFTPYFNEEGKIEFKGREDKTGVISGRVLLGPQCPVLREPPEEECADKPYQTTIHIYPQGNRQEYQVASDENGEFRIAVPAGEYVLSTAPGGGPFPYCQDKSVKVKPDEFTDITILCDTGIR